MLGGCGVCVAAWRPVLSPCPCRRPCRPSACGPPGSPARRAGERLSGSAPGGGRGVRRGARRRDPVRRAARHGGCRTRADRPARGRPAVGAAPAQLRGPGRGGTPRRDRRRRRQRRRPARGAARAGPAGCPGGVPRTDGTPNRLSSGGGRRIGGCEPHVRAARTRSGRRRRERRATVGRGRCPSGGAVGTVGRDAASGRSAGGCHACPARFASRRRTRGGAGWPSFAGMAGSAGPEVWIRPAGRTHAPCFGRTGGR